jgi:transcriptional regulator GlxA family with amidase domain
MRAAALLVKTNYQVQEIAFLTGFESQYHFSRAFKSVFGSNPSAYRRSGAAGAKIPIHPVIAKRFS